MILMRCNRIRIILNLNSLVSCRYCCWYILFLFVLFTASAGRFHLGRDNAILSLTLPGTWLETTINACRSQITYHTNITNFREFPKPKNSNEKREKNTHIYYKYKDIVWLVFSLVKEHSGLQRMCKSNVSLNIYI